jgi:hypothetical protein
MFRPRRVAHWLALARAQVEADQGERMGDFPPRAELARRSVAQLSPDRSPAVRGPSRGR